MNPKEYLANVLITESCDFTKIKARIDDRMIRLIHSGTGMSSELSELIDALSKNDIDWINVMEETADVAWYVSVAVDAAGFDPEEISKFEKNIDTRVLWEKTTASSQEVLRTVTWCVGNLNDLLKKHLMYGRDLNVDKMKEILQQTCLSLSAMCWIAGFTIKEARERNIAKLKVRFNDKFTEAAALNRDLETERKILEGGG